MVQGWLTKKENLRGYESTRGKVIRGSKRMIIILAICYPPLLASEVTLGSLAEAEPDAHQFYVTVVFNG
jgi:hypothetical protein